MAPRTRGRLLAVVLAVALCASCLAAPLAGATYDPIGSGQTTLRLAPSFLSTLRTAGVKLSATAPARLAGGGVSFPVAGGKLDPVSVRGTLEHSGALVFKAGGKSLPMKGLQLKTTQASSPLSAKFGGGKLKLAASSKLTTERSGFGLAMKVSSIRLSAKVATRLEKKLGLHGAFAPNQLLGTAVSEAQPAIRSIAIALSDRRAKVFISKACRSERGTTTFDGACKFPAFSGPPAPTRRGHRRASTKEPGRCAPAGTSTLCRSHIPSRRVPRVRARRSAAC